jgi:CubicO group peptidase (beta-lactamase class C family)
MKNNSKVCLFLSLLCLLPLAAQGQSLEFASASSVGLSDEGLDAVTQRLQQHVDEGDIAGVVAAVARDGKVVYFEALGLMDIEQRKPMREDALFRIYSMAREITSVAVLQLYEEGAFQLDDPIKMYLPEFEEQMVLVDPNADGDGGWPVRARNGDITVAQLLTHTSGLGSRNSRLYRENNVRDRNITLDQMVSNAARVPLFYDPGTQFNYGIHATILGKLIEVWSGRPFEEYLAEELFQPLAMNSTMFWAEGEDAERLASLYRPTDGRLLPYQIESVPWTMRPRLIEGGVGLLSTVMDFMHFSQMVLNRGSLFGNQILSPEVADLMYENAVPDQAMPIGERGYWRGSGWTLGGFNLVMDPDTYSYPVSEGTIWWDGSAGTRYFIDPQQNMIMVIMAQVSPSSGGGFRENFKTLVDAAIVERR